MTETTTDLSEGMLKHEQPTFHFYAHNAFQWRTSTDLHRLMKEMDREGYAYWVWYVPGKETSTYEINWYQPQVKGSFVLAQVEKKQRGRRDV